MTDEELDAAEALSNQATPGPWTANHDDTSSWIEAPSMREVALLSYRHSPRDEEDARFIAAARTLVPQLIAELREAREQVRLANIDWANAETVMDAQESELDRMRPVFEAACAWRNSGHWLERVRGPRGGRLRFVATDETTNALADAVNAAQKVQP